MPKKIESSIYDVEGKESGKIVLPIEIFGVKINPQLVAQSVRIYQANQRQGTKNTKTRSMVTGSTRKIYKQKGTGRARHGDIKAPIFIGGGIAHGPHPKDFSLDFPKKMRRKALFCILTDALQSGKIKFVQGLKEIPAKTRDLARTFDNWNLGKKKQISQSTLLILAQSKSPAILAGRNMVNLTVMQANQLHTYAVLTHKSIVIEKEAVEVLEKTFLSTKSKDKMVSTKTEKAISKETKKEIPVKKTVKKKPEIIKKPVKKKTIKK